MVRPTYEEITEVSRTPSYEDIVSMPLPLVPRGKAPAYRDIVSKKPAIGFVEAAVEKPWEKVAFSPIRAIRTARTVVAARRLSKDDYTKAPTFFAAETPGILGKFFPALTGDWTPKLQKDYDIKIVEDYLKDLDEKERRGYTTMGRVGGILSEMPSFIVEFIATGGLKKLTTEAVKRAGRRAIGRYATTTAGKAALATTGYAVGTAVRAAGMPHRAAEAIIKRQLPRDMSIAEDGEVTITGPVEKPMTSIWKGLTDHWIEVASEEAGELVPIIGKYLRKSPMLGKLMTKIRPKWLKLHPGKTIADFNKKILKPGGFHGVIGEVGEEYLGDATRAITTVEDFGANAIAQEKYGRNANPMERLVAGYHADNENLVPMLIAFSVPGAVGKAANIHERKQARKIAEHQKKLEEIQSEDFIPTQIETAEGQLGFEDDFVLEKWEKKYPKEKFKKPFLLTKYLHTKWGLNRILGIEPLLEDVTNAKMALQIEQRGLNNWVKKLIPRLKKEKDLARLPEILPREAEKEATIVRPAPEALETAEGIIGFEEGFDVEIEDIGKTKAHILQTKVDSKKPLHIMRDLLDTYKDAPSFLTKSEAKIFNEVRELTRYLKDVANISRRAMGLKEIGDVGEYITHWLDNVSKQIVNKNIPVQSGPLYGLMKDLPKEITKNKTALQRKVRKNMENMFSKDLGKLLRIMISYDLKDAYLRQPYHAAIEELKKLNNLKLIPERTYKAAEEYLKFDIQEYKTDFDKDFDSGLEKPVQLLNRILPASKAIYDPSTAVFGRMRRIAHFCGLGWRLRPVFRNLGQRLLLLDLYRTVDYAKAQAVAFRMAKMPIVKDPVTGSDINLMDLIKRQDWYKLGLHKFEDTVASITGVEHASMYLYGKSHIGNLFLSNVEVSALTGYFDWKQMYEKSQDSNSNHYKRCVKQAKINKTFTQELLTQESDMLWNIREAVRRTQWEYFSISMPTFFRGEIKRGLGTFQSWWMNYYLNHCRECGCQILTGRNSRGRLLPTGGRYRALKGIGSIHAISRVAEGLFGIEMLKYLFMPEPWIMGPIPALAASILQLFFAKNEDEKKKALKELKRNLKFWVPFSAFGRDLHKVFTGEWDISDFLFYKKKESK